MKTIQDLGINNNKTFIIAEIGLNHGGSLDEAYRLIDSAANTGVDAVKFQTYETEKRTFKGSPIFDVLKQCELSNENFVSLKKHADEQGLIFFSTPFDNNAVDFLKSINVSLMKLSSFDLANNPFLKYVAQSKIPTVLSSGMSNLGKIENAVNVFEKENTALAILHCVSSYPTKDSDSNLAAIKTLEKHFNLPIGQSDHTPEIEVPYLAVAAGATILEKHYRIDKDMDCVDAPVSITEAQMKELVSKVRYLEEVMGEGELKVGESEIPALQFCREAD